MTIECTLQVELPFVLNLPTQQFSVAISAVTLPILVSNDSYAVQRWNGTDPGSAGMAIGTLDELSASLDQPHSSSPAKKLRTVVRHKFVVPGEQADFPHINDDEQLDVMKRAVLLSSAERPSIEELELRSRAALEELNAESREAFVLQERIRRHAHAALVGAEPLFLQALNRLIRWYAVEMADLFVEEVGLHQLAATVPKGVLRTVVVDGRQLESVSSIGKVPPLMHTPWMRPSATAVASLANRLAGADDPDFADVLVHRARHLLERTAYRSAIAEAAASLEVAVARAIRRAMAVMSNTAPQIDAELAKTKMNFPLRAEITLKTWCTKGVLQLDASLWALVKDDRSQHRNAVVHSDREPVQADAEAVVDRFARMTTLVRKHC